ncbi:hypothetical protein DXG01_006975, partial [Tephrocybe rancida]
TPHASSTAPGHFWEQEGSHRSAGHARPTPEYAPCTAAADAAPRVENRRRGGVMSADGPWAVTQQRGAALQARSLDSEASWGPGMSQRPVANRPWPV